MTRFTLPAAVLATLLGFGLSAPAATAAEPTPGPSDPAYTARDTQNINDAYGRITGPGGQLQNPAYLVALNQEIGATSTAQLLTQVANPTRLALTAGQYFPGWNVGNPLRASWEKSRGQVKEITFTNRYGALLRGHLYRPNPGARDPYTGKRLRGPFPGVVITEGSIQGSEGMYEWLAQDLAERGYVVMTYDVQGQGTSETLPHENGGPLPFCNPFAPPGEGEMSGCPGVPFQQESNFVVGTEDALSFFTSTPGKHYANPKAAGAAVTTFNPYWRDFDRSPDPTPNAKGRTTRIAVIGHSLGAAAVSKVQATDDRVATVVALDKLRSGDYPSVVPALGVQSEYGFTVAPWFASSGSSLTPSPSPDGPDPARERTTGFDGWRAADVDSMVIVPRASTHLEYTDIPLVMPASRHGQALTSVYVQRWLDRYLKHRGGAAALRATSFRYLEPTGNGRWTPITLRRKPLLSFYYCSAYSIRDARGTHTDLDIADVGC